MLSINSDNLGGFLIGIGAAIRLTAILQNPDFSIEIKQPANLCTNGIYSELRHASYTGTLLILFGFSLVAFSLQSAIILTLFGFWFLRIRANKEDQILLETFPETFPEYKNTVGGFIPKLK